MEQEEAKTELKRINASIKDNRSFVTFISNMRIYVRSSSGEEILVTPDNIVDYKDWSEMLEARKKIVSQKLSSISRQLELGKKVQKVEEEQLSFFTAPSMLEITGRKIARLPLDAVAIQRMIDNIDKQLQEVRQKITNNTKFNNTIVAPFDIQEIREITSYDELELDTIGDTKTAVLSMVAKLCS